MTVFRNDKSPWSSGTRLCAMWSAPQAMPHVMCLLTQPWNPGVNFDSFFPPFCQYKLAQKFHYFYLQSRSQICALSVRSHCQCTSMHLLSKCLIRVDYAILSIPGAGDTALKRINNTCFVGLTFLFRISLFLAFTITFISCFQASPPGIYPSQEHQSWPSKGQSRLCHILYSNDYHQFCKCQGW